MIKELMKEVKKSIDNKKMEKYINDVVNTTKTLKDDDLYVSEFPIYNNSEKGVVVTILTDVYSEDIALRVKIGNEISLDFPVADFDDLDVPFEDIKDALDDIAKDMDGKLSKLLKPLLVKNNESTERLEIIAPEDNDDNETSIGGDIVKGVIPAESNNSVYSINLEKMCIGESITITKLNQNSICVIKNSSLNLSVVKVIEDGNEIAVESYNKGYDIPSSSIVNTIFKKLYEKMNNESIIVLLMNIFNLGKTKLNKLLK